MATAAELRPDCGGRVATIDYALDDGSVVTLAVSPAVAAGLAELAADEARVRAKRGRREVDATSLRPAGRDDEGRATTGYESAVDRKAPDVHKAAGEQEHWDSPAGQVDEVRRTRYYDLPPRPTVILGLDSRHPGPQVRQRGVPWACRSCRGRPLARNEYCAADGCDRYGRQYLLPAKVPPLPPSKLKDDGLAGGKGSAAAKAKAKPAARARGTARWPDPVAVGVAGRPKGRGRKAAR